jgi:hypothetical protein
MVEDYNRNREYYVKNRHKFEWKFLLVSTKKHKFDFNALITNL